MKVIFFDRDNTLNYDPGYLSDPDGVYLLPYVVEGLKILQKLNFQFIIITNQSGIGRGYFTEETLFKINQKLLSLLSKEGIDFLNIFYCPHTEKDNCSCRKPKPGLIHQALSLYPEIDLQQSWIIGDRISDIKTGESLSIKGILIDSSLQPDGTSPKNLIHVARNLKDAAEFIENHILKRN
ncbi:MAG: HAD family hydrolase [Leptospiraceae bacterium]|nr:HAD family hydrolase [Leptospiraceae bacterium]MDW7975063.1 HAD family hydrolase [Leptospiraceae bacterium]